MVVPALLTDKILTLQAMLDSCAKFTDFVQIDIMDGQLVPSASVALKDLFCIKTCLASEAHLMVKDPLVWLEAFKKLKSRRIVYHYEAPVRHDKIIAEITRAGFKVGLAVNPQTKINDFKHLVGKLDCVLFMSVNPGFYGAEFIPAVLTKISAFKKSYPHTSCGIDGGVKADNLTKIVKSGVDFVCVGSAILKAPDPKVAYDSLLRQFEKAKQC